MCPLRRKMATPLPLAPAEMSLNDKAERAKTKNIVMASVAGNGSSLSPRGARLENLADVERVGLTLCGSLQLHLARHRAV